jgi:hypothetical protein
MVTRYAYRSFINGPLAKSAALKPCAATMLRLGLHRLGSRSGQAEGSKTVNSVASPGP